MKRPTDDPALSSSSTLALASASRGLRGRLRSKPKLLLCLFASLAGFALVGGNARAQSSIVQWGEYQGTPPALPPGLSYVEVASGGSTWLGGASYGPRHSLARLSDGSVVAWGDNTYGQCNVPALPPGLTYVEIAASGDGSVARLSDGSVVAWGDNSYGQCNVPVLPPGLSYVEVATGGGPTLTLRLAVAFSPLPMRSRGAATALSWSGEWLCPARRRCRRA